jgi:hypothetical protein
VSEIDLSATDEALRPPVPADDSEANHLLLLNAECNFDGVRHDVAA